MAEGTRCAEGEIRNPSLRRAAGIQQSFARFTSLERIANCAEKSRRGNQGPGKVCRCAGRQHADRKGGDLAE